MSKSKQCGFSLVEVLVAVFVLAFGVIGVAALQLTAMRTSRQSSFQTSAVELAAEMADKMRANSRQMKRIDRENPYLKVDYQSQSGVAASPGALCYSAAADCDAEELAAFDIYEWEKRLAASLPAGRAKICRDSRPWDDSAKSLRWACEPASGSVVIKIGWQERNPDGSFGADGGRAIAPIVALTVMPYTQ